MILDPRTEPTADVASPRNCAKIMKLPKQTTVRQALQHAEPESRATDAAARYAQRRALFF